MPEVVSAVGVSIYESLDDPDSNIRLLKLDGSAGHDRISVRLYQVPLSRKLRSRRVLISHPSYVAVSYTWGPESPTFPILVNGRPFHVRENMYRFLVHVRKTSLVTDPLWIDAICINQADKVEKGTQVQIMGQIFSQAERVLIWLGATSESGTIATYFAEYNVESTSHPPPNDSASSDSESGHPEWSSVSTVLTTFSGDDFVRWDYFLSDIRNEEHTGSMSVELRSSLYRELIDIWTNTYWKRLWIVQEIVLAREVLIIFGDRTIDALLLFHVGRFWEDDTLRRDETHLTAEWFPDLLETIKRHKAGRFVETLGNLLYDHRLQLCADPRDRIYGLQALTKPQYRVIVDYDISIEELFVKILHNVQKFTSVYHQGLAEVRLIMKSLNITSEGLAEIIVKDDQGGDNVKALRKTNIPAEVSVTNYVTESSRCPQCQVHPQHCSDQYPYLNPSEWYTNWSHFNNVDGESRTLAAIPDKGDVVMWCTMEGYVAFLVRIRGWEVVTVESHVIDGENGGWVLYPAWHLSGIFGDRINDKLNKMGHSWLEWYFSECRHGGLLRIKLSPMEFVEFVDLGFKSSIYRRELKFGENLTFGPIYREGAVPESQSIASMIRRARLGKGKQRQAGR